MKYKVAHLTSVHPRGDSRIFFKQCVSLSNHGFETHLVVADGRGDEERSGVRIHDVGAVESRVHRMRTAPRSVFRKAFDIDCHIYEIHDPELIPIGLKLKRLGKIVIFDSHEDYPKQIACKTYINAPLRWVFAKMFGIYERWAGAKLDMVFTAAPPNRDKFLRMGVKSIDINNFPIIEELKSTIPWQQKANEICYVGGLSLPRGIVELVKAISLVENNATLSLCGKFSHAALRDTCVSMPGWTRVNERGFLDRNGVRSVLDRSRIGLVTLHPTKNYVEARAVKMFEYMAAGLPVVASNFPLWREIVEQHNCGICVDPMNVVEIAAAINRLLSSPELCERMGRNGRSAVESFFNWGIEEAKLLGVYQEFCSKVNANGT